MKLLLLLLTRILEKLLMLMMACIVITVTWQVISRFLLQSPSSVTEELARFLLIWIGLLGAAYAYKTRAHLGLDLFVGKLSAPRRNRVRILIECTVLVFAVCIMMFGGTSLVLITLELNQISAALGWQMGLIYSVLPVSGSLIALFALDNIAGVLKPKQEQEKH